jgi:carboxyl-terminal processing protease
MTLNYKKVPAMPKNNRFSSGKIFICSGLILVSLLLNACGVYQGYPTPVPVTATPDTTQPTPTTTPLAVPTYPPLPTATPRPTLPPAPTGVQLTKQNVLQAAYDNLLKYYYQPLNSGDLYEVGLNGIRDALKQAGVSQPDVPIPAFTGTAQQDWPLFLQAFTITLSRYRSNLAEDKMAYAALQHSTQILNECGGPLTAFYPPDQSRDYLNRRDGLNPYTGLGINILPFDNTSGYYITRVISGTPADKSGLKLGDAIVAVEGQDITKLDQSQVLGLLQGKTDTKVNLTVRRAGSGKQETVQLTRGQIQPPVIEQRLLPDNIAYIKFNAFPGSASLLQDFDRLLSDFNNRGVKGFILDVRGTRVGNLITARNIASRFVSGQDLVYLLGRDQQGQSNVVSLTSASNVKATDKPIALLVDQNTSNEAEVFAQIIKNKKRGQIFGSATAGCTLVSDVVMLPDNSVLSIVAYRSLTDGSDPQSFTDQIAPDVAVTVDQQSLSQGQDATIEKAAAYIKTQ